MAEEKAKSGTPKKRTPQPTPADVDVWRMPELTPEQAKGAFTEESSFATLFPKYREKYIKEIIGVLQRELGNFGIKLELDLAEGSLTVRTTKKAWDPYAIIKARDVIKLIARSVPYQVALRVMQPEIYCDIIKTKNLASGKEKFVKRRARLIGPSGGTLKCLEILTNCYILVQGSTVCVVGQFRQLKQVRRIVEEVMRNVHPLYHIKELMIRRELEKDEKLRGENWDKYLPQFSKIRSVKRKIKKAKVAPKERSVFPEAPTPRKEDLLVASGEYFLSEEQRKARSLELKKAKQARMKEKKAEERNERFVPPAEKPSEGKAVQPKESKPDIKGLLRRFNIPSPAAAPAKQ